MGKAVVRLEDANVEENLKVVGRNEGGVTGGEGRKVGRPNGSLVGRTGLVVIFLGANVGL